MNGIRDAIGYKLQKTTMPPYFVTWNNGKREWKVIIVSVMPQNKDKVEQEKKYLKEGTSWDQDLGITV